MVRCSDWVEGAKETAWEIVPVTKELCRHEIRKYGHAIVLTLAMLGSTPWTMKYWQKVIH
jgi:hypothetical protein